MSEFDTYETTPSGDASPEVNDADAYEQGRDVVEDGDDDLIDVPDGVDPADAVEQHRLVGGDDEEYGDR